MLQVCGNGCSSGGHVKRWYTRNLQARQQALWTQVWCPASRTRLQPAHYQPTCETNQPASPLPTNLRNKSTRQRTPNQPAKQINQPAHYQPTCETNQPASPLPTNLLTNQPDSALPTNLLTNQPDSALPTNLLTNQPDSALPTNLLTNTASSRGQRWPGGMGEVCGGKGEKGLEGWKMTRWVREQTDKTFLKHF